MYYHFLKRVLDLAISILLIVILFPFLFLTALLIKLDSKGPIFFTQTRVGKNMEPFKLYKFRTMTDEKREVTKIIGKAEGVTKIGYYLRRYKIDELPQLINVCKGEMSLVGPRPSIVEQLEEMTENEKKRYSVRPGMTGLAQVSGNIHISWPERYKYDLKYVNNVLFLNDLRILIRTILIVMRGEEKFVDSPLTIRETT